MKQQEPNRYLVTVGLLTRIGVPATTTEVAFALGLSVQATSVALHKLRDRKRLTGYWMSAKGRRGRAPIVNRLTIAEEKRLAEHLDQLMADME